MKQTRILFFIIAYFDFFPSKAQHKSGSLNNLEFSISINRNFWNIRYPENDVIFYASNRPKVIIAKFYKKFYAISKISFIRSHERLTSINFPSLLNSLEFYEQVFRINRVEAEIGLGKEIIFNNKMGVGVECTFNSAYVHVYYRDFDLVMTPPTYSTYTTSGSETNRNFYDPSLIVNLQFYYYIKEHAAKIFIDNGFGFMFQNPSRLRAEIGLGIAIPLNKAT